MRREFSTQPLYGYAIRCLDKRPGEARLYGRHFVEGQVWPPGRGGWSRPGQMITSIDEAMLFFVALLASATAAGCVEAALLYRDLVHRATGRTFGQAVAELIERALTPEGRWDLRGVWIQVARNTPTARIRDSSGITEFHLPPGRSPTQRQQAARREGPRVEIIAHANEDVIKAFGAALGAPEMGDAPQAEAGEAPQVSVPPRANGGKLEQREQTRGEREFSQPRRSGRSPRQKSLILKDDGEHHGDDPPRAPAA